LRKELKKEVGVRKTFTAVFNRYGNKNGWKGTTLVTLLFTDVRDNGNLVADHIWFTKTKGFSLDLKEGDKVQFDARVKEYLKGYKGYKIEAQIEKPLEIDYKLSNPTKIKKVL